MLFNPSKTLFMTTLIIGIIITISSNSWLSVWMGLEINLLSFIPLMTDEGNLYSNEASLKYFLTQAMASSLLLFSIILFLNYNLLNFNLWNINFWTKLSLINLTLLIKMGSAPFHFWFPSVMNCLSWFNNWILMTIQKIAPFILIFYSFNFYINMMSLILSLIFGSLGGLNQTSVRKIMAYSSINHLSWMLCSIFFSKNLWLNYFFFYYFLTSSIVLLFNLFNIFYINQFFLYFNNNLTIKFSIFILLLSLGGLPPFLGFFPKWLVIQYLMFNNFYFILLLMVIFTLFTLYFYLQMTYSAFMINSWNFKWNINKIKFNFNWFFMFMSFTSIFGLMFIFFYF
uniref:NADH-ubiquinone oxidoreductase chain 2 n=1 Tax=Phlebotomus chinensis TaxID=641374 RepID=A0A0N7EHP6_9DIPT|nr:NADH dehydrogenase subunit 2 [Phlebotomus chinensis]WPV76914.1 NADH dehydrogenase subunit 2 [Phlebotomus sichuanensis]ALF07235.1 NADH dehydrogenase subunit 2 [Phlebotomus chinensis]WPV76927.1 NADH dehydrogenase subunit 2 [Phlebotomus sichuanensis]WPV76940.1 NADH dehydrogenase subunit 2 [Phlebotomus sichuanensis]WPV76953.1 NADH dehydrogenase subunit 2 [Phlebotomus sichuanensis]